MMSMVFERWQKLQIRGALAVHKINVCKRKNKIEYDCHSLLYESSEKKTFTKRNTCLQKRFARFKSSYCSNNFFILVVFNY